MSQYSVFIVPLVVVLFIFVVIFVFWLLTLPVFPVAILDFTDVPDVADCDEDDFFSRLYPNPVYSHQQDFSVLHDRFNPFIEEDGVLAVEQSGTLEKRPEKLSVGVYTHNE